MQCSIPKKMNRRVVVVVARSQGCMSMLLIAEKRIIGSTLSMRLKAADVVMHNVTCVCGERCMFTRI